MAKHTTLVVFGGTGDLTKRKLVPAFAKMLDQGTLAKDSLLVGVGRSDYNDKSYRQLLEKNADKKDKACIKHLTIKYVRLSSYEDSYKPIKDVLKKHEKGNDRLFYLAISYKLFPNIISNLKKANIHQNAKHYTRIVFEKPFGYNYKSAFKLEKSIHSVFKEEQIFRIDHYLGKETVQNLTLFKYTNPLIDAIMNHKFIEKIEVIADEDLGVGSRLGYYDGAGAVKDMVQSHLLQVLSLVLMQRPKCLEVDDIHDEKLKMLKSLKVLPAKHQQLGQYEGYSKEIETAGLKPSETETFCRLHLQSTHKNWRGVDLFLQTGKHMAKKNGQIIIHFHNKHFYCGVDQEVPANKIIIDIQPEEDIKLLFNTRKRFSSKHVEQVEMEFCGNCYFGANTADGYGKLLTDVIEDDRTLFTKYEEVMQSWKIVDQFETMRKNIHLQIYKKGVERL